MFAAWLFVLVDLVDGAVCVLVVVMSFDCLGVWLHEGSCAFDLAVVCFGLLCCLV